VTRKRPAVPRRIVLPREERRSYAKPVPAVKAPTKRKTPQQKRSALERKADGLFSQIVRLRDGGCVAVGHRFECVGVLQCAHVWGRRYRSIRHDEANAVCLCRAHHYYFGQTPFEWYEFMEQRLGKREWVLLRERALFGAKPDYSELIPRLQARLEELEA
jgi:hypothetical protein